MFSVAIGEPSLVFALGAPKLAHTILLAATEVHDTLTAVLASTLRTGRTSCQCARVRASSRATVA